MNIPGWNLRSLKKRKPMQLDTAILVGVLFACATYLILQRSFVKALFGLIILSNAANLVVLSVSGDPRGKEAPIASGVVLMVDPLPQALILTAIVIGFGLIAYGIVLMYRIFLDHKTTNAADLYAEEVEGERKGP
jgi:multicomponent Na+:H+ antiporter subunit C